MEKKMLPLNIGLLTLTPEQLTRVPQIKSLGITEGPGGNFDEEGLFSTSIFGRIGDPRRDVTFGRIDLRLPIIHPIIHRVLTSMRGFYGDVMAGKEYAVFNPHSGTFEKSNEIDGKTGFTFFMDNWEKLKLEKGKSPIRNTQIDLLNKYRGKSSIVNLLVLPAGLRDVEVDAVGRVTFTEINEYYQKCLMLSRNFPDHFGKDDDLSVYDRTRYAIQMQVILIYEHLKTLISGKNGVIQAKWASRRVFNGTRNVISAMDVTATDLDAPNRPGFNSAVVGVFQAAHANIPLVVHNLRVNLLENIFNTSSNQVQLINKETLQLEWVDVTNETMDRWSSEEGIEKVINELSVTKKRHRPVLVEDHYIALIYTDDQKGYRIIRDVDDIPESIKNPKLRPITYVEMIYLTNLDMWENIAGFITRYPVENFNSSSPAIQYVKTTTLGELRYELDDDFVRTGRIAKEFPVFKEGVEPTYHDSLSIPVTRLGAMGADFDGDTASFVTVYTEEANSEARSFFKKRRAYIQASGGLSFGVDIHTVNLTLAYITGKPKVKV